VKQRIACLEEENRGLKEELEAMKSDPGYFESLARRELGLIKPGETKYKFIESQEEKSFLKKPENEVSGYLFRDLEK